MMVKVFIGLGSNIEKEKNIKNSLLVIRENFGDVIISPLYKCKPYGFDGDDFLNLVVSFITDRKIEDLICKLKDIEYKFGRTRLESSYSPRTLDIDLLLYGDLISKKYDVPRKDIGKYAFVLKPLYDIEPDLIHPKSGKTIRNLWENFCVEDKKSIRTELIYE